MSSGGGGLSRRASRRTPVLGLLLLLAGAVAVAGSGQVTAAQVTGQSRPAPVNAGADDPLDISAHNSPTLARNPLDADNLVLVNRVDLPLYTCAFHVSFDAGVTWEETAVPQPPGTEPKCFAPDVTFGPDGTLHLAYVMLAGHANAPDSVWLASSTDGGRSLSEPRQATGALAFQVRLAADPTVADRLYLTWVQAGSIGPFSFPETGNPIVMARSDDGGATWRGPLQVSDPSRERVLAPTPAIGDGTLFVLHLDVLDDRLNYHGAHGGLGGPPYPGPWELVLRRSDDGGRTWSESSVDADVVPMERYSVFLPPSPSLAVDGDRMYVAFQDARLGDADVWMWSSADRGASWGPGVRVNDTPQGDGTSQYLPAVAAAPGGRLDVVYYDRRADPDDVMNEVSLQYSTDGGRTFSRRVRLSDMAFDSRIGFGARRGMPDLGSRLALLSTADGALSAWPDTRNVIPDVVKQDIFRAAVTFEPVGGAGQTALRWSGAGLVAAGVVATAIAMGRRRTRRGRSSKGAAGKRAGSGGRSRQPARRR